MGPGQQTPITWMPIHTHSLILSKSSSSSYKKSQLIPRRPRPPIYSPLLANIQEEVNEHSEKNIERMRSEDSATLKAILGTFIRMCKKRTLFERERGRKRREWGRREREREMEKNHTLFIFHGWRRERSLRATVDVEREEPKRKGKTGNKRETLPIFSLFVFFFLHFWCGGN